MDGSYIIPHFYIPVFEDKFQIGHFEVADEKRERDLFERYCADSDMRKGKSVLKELREYERMMGICGAGEGRERQKEER